MCGRYTLANPDPKRLRLRFGLDPTAEVDEEPRYNIAPTDPVLAVRERTEQRDLGKLRWGLLPGKWATERGQRPLINARAESIATQPAFAESFRERRCLIPADGFYEWRKVPGSKQKQPYFVSRPDGEPFAFAGLWEVWKGPKDAEGNRTGDPLRSCTIITTTPNDTMAQIHDRMPVILPPSAWDEWLDPDNDDIETLGKLLVPAPASLTELRPVSTEVNNVRNKGVELAAEIPADQIIVADSADS